VDITLYYNIQLKKFCVIIVHSAMEFKYDFYSRGGVSLLRLLLGAFLFFSTIYLIIYESFFSWGISIMYILIGLILIIEGMGFKTWGFFGKKFIEIDSFGMHFKLSLLRKGIFFPHNEIKNLTLSPGKIIVETSQNKKSINLTGFAPQLRHNLLMAVLSFAKQNNIRYSKQGYLERYE
jgi:hypothetical protein